MAVKKDQILVATLKLFANEGFKAVASKKMAKEAEVSEGLIFRHYKSKQGLLEAILGEAFERMRVLFTPMIVEKNPKKIIRKYILLPFEIAVSEYQF